MSFKRAFTLLELVFVIVILGILGKFGVEFLANAYTNFIQSEIASRQAANSAYAVEFIAKRLEYRIKPSVIVRHQSDVSAGNWGVFESLEGKNTDTQEVIEWIGYDVESFRGLQNTAHWSGIYDKNFSVNNPAQLFSPGTNTADIDTMIDILSYTRSSIDDAALFFMGGDSDVETGYGWDNNLTRLQDMNITMKAIQDDANTSLFIANPTGSFNTFATTNVLNFDDQSYKLSWSAYAIVHNTVNDELWFIYDYQPWKGETLLQGRSMLIMDNVSSFYKSQQANVMRIVVCTKNAKFFKAGEDDYSVCKEKTVL